MLLRPDRTIDARELEPLALGARWVVVYQFAARELAFGVLAGSAAAVNLSARDRARSRTGEA